MYQAICLHAKLYSTEVELKFFSLSLIRNDITSTGEAGENIITEPPPAPVTLHIYTKTGQKRTQQCSMTTRSEKSDACPDGDITENLPVASGSGGVRAMPDAVEKEKKN